MSNLELALGRSRDMIEEALADARSELESLNARRAELEEQVARGEAALRAAASPDGAKRTLTLHEALADILRESRNSWMTARELAIAVNERGLYRKRDGSSVEPNQVAARTNNYDTIFEKEGSKIRLREESPVLAAHPTGVTVFRDDDSGFFQWLDQNPDGYFINCERNPTERYLVLHLASCSHIDRSPSLHWTKDYVKVCSSGRVDLEEWAAEAVDGDVTLCRTCFDR